MPRKRESLGEEIRHVNAARDVADKELQLSHSVPKPVKPHVARLRELRLDGPIGKAYCDFVVAVDHRCLPQRVLLCTASTVAVQQLFENL